MVDYLEHMWTTRLETFQPFACRSNLRIPNTAKVMKGALQFQVLQLWMRMRQVELLGWRWE